MKPLELRIYEKHPDADAYRVRGFFTPYALVARANRFTGAELAAEYHAQLMETVKAHDRAYPWGESEELDIENARVEVVERFATLPHFDGAS